MNSGVSWATCRSKMPCTHRSRDLAVMVVRSPKHSSSSTMLVSMFGITSVFRADAHSHRSPTRRATNEKTLVRVPGCLIFPIGVCRRGWCARGRPQCRATAVSHAFHRRSAVAGQRRGDWPPSMLRRRRTHAKPRRSTDLEQVLLSHTVLCCDGTRRADAAKSISSQMELNAGIAGPLPIDNDMQQTS